LTFAVDRAVGQVPPDLRAKVPQYFPMPNLAVTHDDIADGRLSNKEQTPRPLALFSAEPIDYSLHRLRHYTATDPSYFQNFVLFTNYQRYVDEFIAYGRAQVKEGHYETFVEPGNRITRKDRADDAPV